MDGQEVELRPVVGEVLGMCSPRRQRRCVVCRKGFVPDPRVGDRQRTCSKSECRQEYRKRVQADWRKRHPGYFSQWRAKERAACAAGDPVDPLRMAAPLSTLPWDLAQAEFGVAGADFLGSMGRLLVIHAKDEISLQVREIVEDLHQVGPGVAKDEMPIQVLGSTGETREVGAELAKDEIRAMSG